jgi:hypothetical protein
MAADVVLCALKHVWVSLEPLKIPMALMGGLALAAWKVAAPSAGPPLESAFGFDRNWYAPATVRS